ncbi:MAG: nitroreductase family deazaflavin-dependent oxidoreductase [Acidimicrobiia bacterium]
MPYPRWLARVNKRVFNPREVRKGKRPVVIHVGRSSGTVYQTPLDAHPTKEGYVLVVRYGPGSDWVRNILVAGTATLRVGGEELRLDSPRLVSQQEAVDQLVPSFEPDADFFKAEHYLLMEHSD